MPKPSNTSAWYPFTHGADGAPKPCRSGRNAAKQTGKPLIVGEGSIDAAAYAYPAYFEDPSMRLRR